MSGKTELSSDSLTVQGKAQVRHLRMTPMKARRMVDLIRGKHAVDALALLQFAPQAASTPVKKLLHSAIANARYRAEQTSSPFDELTLVVSEAYVDEGPTMKRFRPRAQGRAGRILKRTSHITIRVSPTEKARKSQVGGAR